MKMKIVVLFILSVFATLKVTDLFAQQDPQFSQYMFNPLYANPAYAGSRGVVNGALAYRKQWIGFEGAPSTMAFAVNMPSKKGKVGIGFEVFNDKIGPKTTTGAMVDYAYRIPLGKGKLAFGLGAGLMSFNVNWDEVTYKDGADSYNQLGVVKITKPDFKFGIYYNSKKFYTGISFTHLNQEVYSVTQDSLMFTAIMSRHSYITVGRAFQIADNVVFSPSIMFRNSGNNLGNNVDLNLNFKLRDVLWVGLTIRSNKCLVALVQYSITNHLKLGYSFDMSGTRLATYSSGTHEIVLAFDLNFFQSKVLSPRFF